MKTTLVLCTKNGGERLGNCLDHIEALDVDPDFEVILVDNNSDDGVSRPAMDEYARTSRHHTRVLDCKRPGNSAGRNVAIRAAGGDLLIFLDDDCYAAPDLVRCWQRIFAAHEIGYGTGKVIRHDPAMSMLGCRETNDIVFMKAGGLVEPGFLKGSNMAFRKSCFDTVGLFDERMGSGVPFAGEDWDMSLRLSFGGIAGGYFPEPTVSHDHRRPDDGTADGRLDFYEYGNGAVFAKHMRGKQFFMLARRFLKQLRRLRRTSDRLATFLRGYRDFKALEVSTS